MKPTRGAPRAELPLTAAQVRLIQTARQQCSMDEAIYRATLRRVAGVDSCKAARRTDFDALVQAFKAHGFVHRPHHVRRPPQTTRPGMATPGQCRMILALWRELHGAHADDQGLSRWLERSYGVSHLHFATAAVAQMAIEGIKAMTRRRRPAPTPSPQREEESTGP